MAVRRYWETLARLRPARAAAGPGVVLIAAIVIFACRSLFALVLIPPWQQPDENSHVALVELQRAKLELLDGEADPAREGEILYSMAQFDWWKLRGRTMPTPIPGKFNSAGDGTAVDPESFSSPPIYYPMMGRLLSWMPRRSVVKDLYALRTISLTLSIVTLVVSWFAVSAYRGPAAEAVVVMLLAWHPQFAIVSAAVSADAMVILMGAVLWWLVVLAVRGRRLALCLVGIWGVATCAALTDRMGLPLLVVAFAASVITVLLKVSGSKRKVFVVGSLLTASVGTLAVLASWFVLGARHSYGVRFSWADASIFSPVAANWDFFSRFSSSVFASWWLSHGWARYQPPSWWVAIALALVAIAGIGVIRRLQRPEAPENRAIFLLAIVSCAVQLAALYWAYFRLGHGALGKSMYPCLVPSLVLLWAGVESVVPAAHRGRAALALVLVFALLDAAAWALVAIPVYVGS